MCSWGVFPGGPFGRLCRNTSTPQIGPSHLPKKVWDASMKHPTAIAKGSFVVLMQFQSSHLRSHRSRQRTGRWRHLVGSCTCKVPWSSRNRFQKQKDQHGYSGDCKAGVWLGDALEKQAGPWPHRPGKLTGELYHWTKSPAPQCTIFSLLFTLFSTYKSRGLCNALNMVTWEKAVLLNLFAVDCSCFPS